MNVLAGVLFFVAYIPYAIAVIHGDAVPSIATWIVWAVVDTLGAVAMKKKGAESGQITAAAIGAWSIFILSLIYGDMKMGTIEGISITGAVVGIIFWKKTNDALVAIICSQVVLFIGAIPTIVNVWSNPADEDLFTWSLWLISTVCALIAVKKWDVANALQPINFLVIELPVVFLIIRPYVF